MLNAFERFKHAVRLLCGFAALLALLLPTLHIFAKFLGNDAWISRYSEVMIYLLVWATLLSGALLAAEGRHIRVDLLFAGSSDLVQRRLEMLTTVISLAFSMALAWYGAIITWESWDLGERSLSALRFPMWMYFAALPTSAALMALLFLFRLVMLIKGIARPESAEF